MNDEKTYTGFRPGVIDTWMSRAASSVNGTIIVISFLLYVFLSSFKIQYNGTEILVRTDVFNTVFMAFYGLVMTYAGYLWGASKPQTETIKGMQEAKLPTVDTIGTIPSKTQPIEDITIEPDLNSIDTVTPSS